MFTFEYVANAAVTLLGTVSAGTVTKSGTEFKLFSRRFGADISYVSYSSELFWIVLRNSARTDCQYINHMYRYVF